ncbi:MAG: ACT domain-containing protein [Litorilinea sp.]
MSNINYDNRVFRAVTNSAAGEVGAATRFYYRQAGDLIWATYTGGAIRFGTLVGTVDGAGRLDFSYQHVNQQGIHMRGRCHSTPTYLPDGRLRLYEKWQWLLDPDATVSRVSGWGAAGESIIEEVIESVLPPDNLAAHLSEETAAPRLVVSALDGEFCICRLAPSAPIPAWAAQPGWVAITRTTEELSIVCPTSRLPEHMEQNIKVNRGWRCLQVAGPLDLNATGILARLSATLAEANIPLFAISTYDTDYLLVPADTTPRALAVLNGA